MSSLSLRSLSFLVLASVAGCGDSDPKASDTPDVTDTSDAAETLAPDVADVDVLPDGEPDIDALEPDIALDTDVSAEVADTTGPTDTTDVLDATDTTDTTDVLDSADTVEPDTTDTASDVTPPTDTTPTRLNLNADFCPSTPTLAGLYRGTLASNLNDIGGACGLVAPGRDGAVRVELQPGQTVRAAFRHAGDGVLYLLDSCPVVGSCLASSDGSSSGEETLEWTHTGASMNPVYIILDSDDLGGGQTFELDLEITGP